MKINQPRPRVIVDANIYISYLLHSATDAHWTQEIIELAVKWRVELVVPEELIVELSASARSKPYLQKNIDPADADRLMFVLRSIAIPVQPLSSPFPSLTRDTRDDYLLAYAGAYDVDILVTGDKDLLVLSEHLDRPRIMNAREFLEFMQSER